MIYLLEQLKTPPMTGEFSTVQVDRLWVRDCGDFAHPRSRKFLADEALLSDKC
jgi:hypothetical protein